jgi:peptidoglycan/xylan/chitin deacetylase (PgdA/CDA1 family)
MYHNFTGPGAADSAGLDVEGIRRQFTYLCRHFRVVPLLQLADRLSSGRAFDPYSVALTIDDGRRNCYEFLFPLLKEFKLPATFFVVGGFIGGDDWIWTDKVAWLSKQPNATEELARERLARTFVQLNRMRPVERNDWIISTAEHMEVCVPKGPPPAFMPCSWSELREMADSGLVEIGSHTVTHPILSSISDEESWDELVRSRAQIEDEIGRSVRCFCFPNGMPVDYRESQVRQVSEAGYACAVVAESGTVGRGADRYRLPRIGMERKSNTLELSKYLDGVAHYQQELSRWLGIRGN